MESTAMTVYMHWSFTYREPPAGTYYYTLNPTQTGEWSRILTLEEGVSRLKKEWGTVFVPWKEVNRLQRPVNGTFSDDRPSTAVAGGPGIFGIIQEFHSMPVPGQKRWYGRHANSYVSVIEFGPEVRAHTIMPFGQSSDPESPHYNDQSELYGRGDFKQVWTTLEDVKNNAVRAYYPGEEI